MTHRVILQELTVHSIPRDSNLMSKPPTLPQMPQTIYRKNSRGLIEVVDVHTGRILCVQVTHETLLESKWERLTRIDTPEGPVYIEKGLSYDLVPQLRAMPFSQVLADLLAQEVANGATLIAACKKLNLEYSTIKRWEREQDGFKEEIKNAKLDRAEYLHDEALETGRASHDTKVKIAALQWAAEKGDPNKYGNKIKHSGDSESPVTFVLSTGISRTPQTQEQAPTERIANPEGQAEEIVDDFERTKE